MAWKQVVKDESTATPKSTLIVFFAIQLPVCCGTSAHLPQGEALTLTLATASSSLNHNDLNGG